MESEEAKRRFFEDGYFVVRGGLGDGLVADIAHNVRLLLTEEDSLHRRAFPYQGSMIPASIINEPWSRLISSDAILASLRQIGSSDIKWLSGYLISKPPHSPRLWWHQDWWAWNTELSYADMPAQISVLMYPAGSTEQNGCLRVIPGSHRKRHALHDVLPPAHTDEINRLSVSHPAFEVQPDEVTIPLAPNDFVVCDVRLLHATLANLTDAERPGIVLWYLPNYSQLPGDFQTHYAQNQCQPTGHDRLRMAERLSPLVIPETDCSSSIALERLPGAEFR
ncbi:phytanoyl-CoA dioxygenase family protein [Streptomyces sp. NPDC059650]|uniref:phytanoyl-CoA dioxygenase family protein n=1 Tax=Streptomyces sp. NPDC059650 TaxID=3346896 RepID=UPI0036AEFD7D